MAKIPRLRPISDPTEIRPQKKVPELIRVPADKPITGILCCTTLFEMRVHWTPQKRTALCEGDACEHCPHTPVDTYLLVAVVDRNAGDVKWVQLTQYAGLSLLQQLRESQRPMHGAIVKIGRERKALNSPVTVALDLYSGVHGRLPKPITPEETLERVFNSKKPTGKATAESL